jgi:diaminopimelate decarboxylase
MERIKLFPDSTLMINNSLTIGGCSLTDLADQFGTPLYIYDRSTMDNTVNAYKSALASFYPGERRLTYAGKAFLCIAVAEWTQQHDLWVDCSSQGEIAVARRGGVPRERIIAHGVNKSRADLEAASEHAGIIAADNMTELQRLAEIYHRESGPEIWLRFQPGVEVRTHPYTQTGHGDSKFGLDGLQLLNAAQYCIDNSLQLSGLHFHLGSQFRDPTPLAHAIINVLDLARKMELDPEWTLSPGGGWGVAYHEQELPQPSLGNYIRAITDTLIRGCQERNLPLPQLQLEPGRSLVARAGVALYRVGTIKKTASRLWALLDGGLADNPRHALYGARYSALPVSNPDRPFKEDIWFAGPYCESGDVLIEQLPFPEIVEGELIAIPVSGAYQLSMSSNYNGHTRPAVVWVDQGQVQLIQERETTEDILRRDRRLVKPAGTG